MTSAAVLRSARPTEGVNEAPAMTGNLMSRGASNSRPGAIPTPYESVTGDSWSRGRVRAEEQSSDWRGSHGQGGSWLAIRQHRPTASATGRAPSAPCGTPDWRGVACRGIVAAVLAVLEGDRVEFAHSRRWPCRIPTNHRHGDSARRDPEVTAKSGVRKGVSHAKRDELAYVGDACAGTSWRGPKKSGSI
jgi:hypothetical protein